jgi:Uma2 family endonuclease
MSQQRTLLTAGEFFRLYSSKEGHYELVKGKVIEMPPPGWVHGGIAVNIAISLGSFVRQHNLGVVVVESGVWLERQPDTVRGPDVAFVARERIPAEGLPRAFFEGAPDLAVEIVSPSDTAVELEAKVHDYLRNGTLRVWVVYPDSRRVAVHRPDGTARWYSEDAAIGDQEFLPGFSLPLREIFGL